MTFNSKACQPFNFFCTASRSKGVGRQRPSYKMVQSRQLWMTMPRIMWLKMWWLHKNPIYFDVEEVLMTKQSLIFGYKRCIIPKAPRTHFEDKSDTFNELFTKITLQSFRSFQCMPRHKRIWRLNAHSAEVLCASQEHSTVRSWAHIWWRPQAFT